MYRYVSTLTLVRVQMDQTGSYAAVASNEDDEEEVVFSLEVKGQTGRHRERERDRMTDRQAAQSVCVFSAP